jgi:hypothetical protein
MHINVAKLNYGAIRTVWDHVKRVLLSCIPSDSIFAQPFQTAITGMCSTTQPGHVCVSLDISRTRSTSARCRGNSALITCSQTSWRSSQTDESSARAGAGAGAGSTVVRANGEISHDGIECRVHGNTEARTNKSRRRASSIAGPASASVIHSYASDKEDSSSSSTSFSPASAPHATQGEGIDKDMATRQRDDSAAPICCLVHVGEQGECNEISRYMPKLHALLHTSWVPLVYACLPYTFLDVFKCQNILFHVVCFHFPDGRPCARP